MAIHRPRALRSRRLAAIVGCLTVVIVGCSGGQRAAAPTAASTTDTALLSTADVRSVTGIPDLATDPALPTNEPQSDPVAPGPCKAILDQRVALGNDLSRVQTVTLSAPTHHAPHDIRGVATVRQAVGYYPTAVAARTSFAKLEPELRQCHAMQAKGYEYEVATPDQSTLRLTSKVATIVYRLRSAALASVVVIGLPNATDVADRIAASIAQRLN